MARVGGGRLIPARAGKTPANKPVRIGIPAHPRACGENGARADRERFQPGLIPARAGKTRDVCLRLYPDRAHPRACGENLTAPAMMPTSQGSSPRVRGKPRPMGRGPAPGGLIPARAGKTGSASPWARPWWAHPRACGENAAIAGVGGLGAGSSPRVRGKPQRQKRFDGRRGLIPARAGKTRRWTRTTTPGRAHPRACGENATRAFEPCMG